MADELFSEKSFEDGLAVSKRQPISFAFALGKKKEASVLGFHKIKSGEELARLAKKEEGTSSKTAHGTATTKGKLITLNCEEYVPGMKKALKQTFKKRGLQWKVNILAPAGVDMDPEDAEEDFDDEAGAGYDVLDSKQPEGNEYDVQGAAEPEEEDEDEEESEEEANEQATEPGPSLTEIIAQLKQLAPQVVELAKSQPVFGKPLVEIVGEIRQHITNKAAAAASEGLTRLREALASPPPEAPPAPAAPNPLKQQLLQSLPKITPAVARALNSPDVGDQIKQQLRGLVDQLKLDVKNNQLDTAKQLVAQIVALIKQHAPAAPKHEDGPQVAYAKARLSWDAAAKEVHVSLVSLTQELLVDFPEEDALMPKVTAKLDEVLLGFRDELNDVLDDAYSAADAEVRQQHHRRALELISRYRGEVENNPLIDDIEDNPYTSIAVRGPLSSSLTEIEGHLGN